MDENVRDRGATEKPFMTPEELIAHLYTLCGIDKVDSRPALKVGELRELLDRVSIGKFTLKQIKAGVMNALNRYIANNPNGGGLAFPQIWGWLRRGGEEIPFDITETAIAELLMENKIHKTPGGMVTSYLPGGIEHNPDELTPGEKATIEAANAQLENKG